MSDLSLADIDTPLSDESTSARSVSTSCSTPPLLSPNTAASKRDQVAREILSSEQSYVSSLDTLAIFYRIPLEAHVHTSDADLSADDIKSLFSQIDVLLAYHRRLLEDLAESAETWNESSCLGHVFLDIVQFLRLYSNYVNNYPRAQELVKRLYLSNVSGKFLRRLDSQPEVHGLSLKDYLIMPVQRIPRYGVV
jgi:hypothetical protein